MTWAASGLAGELDAMIARRALAARPGEDDAAAHVAAAAALLPRRR